MFELLARLVAGSHGFLTREPILALAIAGAFLAVHLRALFGRGGVTAAEAPAAAAVAATAEPVVSRLMNRAGRLAWAAVLVGALAGTFIGLREYLTTAASDFRFSHGRVTDVNLDAVRTIWGDEQAQRELRVELGYDTEETERLEPEDPTMPAVLRKHTVHHAIEENPFVSSRHHVTLSRSARTKGSAVYPGYETSSRFTYALRNPATRGVHARLRFPLPSDTAMYDDLQVKLDDAPVLDRLTMDGAALVLERDLAPGETFTFEVSFKSRGLSHWYFQVIEPRDLRDFTLVLELPDLVRADLNYPGGCMPPTAIDPTADGRGSLLVWRLDRAISGKGMGVALPTLPQPGETTAAVLGAAVPFWGLLFATLVLCLTLAGVRLAPLVSIFAGALVALGWGLLASASDLLFGFWLSAVVVMVPLFAGVSIATTRLVPGWDGRILAAGLVVFGLLFPCLVGLDDPRAVLYQDLAAVAFVVLAGRLVFRGKSGRPGSLPEDGAFGPVSI